MHPAITVRDDEDQAASPKETVVGPEVMNVLLVSNMETGAGYLRQQLESRGCRCWSATSTEELSAMVDRQSFDLILSTSWLPDRVLGKLADSKSTVFFSYPVRNGCWWLPVLERGRHCLGEPALRGNQFGGLIGQWLRQIRRMSATAA